MTYGDDAEPVTVIEASKVIIDLTNHIVSLTAQLESAEQALAAAREENERLLESLKHRCVCQTNGEGLFVSECHAHAVMRSGRRENGDPVEWRSKPEQFHGPHEPAPVDLVRAELAALKSRSEGSVERVTPGYTKCVACGTLSASSGVGPEHTCCPDAARVERVKAELKTWTAYGRIEVLDDEMATDLARAVLAAADREGE